MNNFFERLSEMIEASTYNNEYVEFLQSYFSDEDTDNFTREDANNLYDLVVEIIKHKEQSPNPELFDSFAAFTEKLNQYKNDSDYALNQDLMDRIASYMDDDIREDLHIEMAPCKPLDFLKAYIARDEEFLKLLENEFYNVYLLVKEKK